MTMMMMMKMKASTKDDTDKEDYPVSEYDYFAGKEIQPGGGLVCQNTTLVHGVTETHSMLLNDALQKRNVD